MKDFNVVIKNLNLKLAEDRPAALRSLWILRNAPDAYRFITKNVRTEAGDVDWDKVISSLDKNFQKIWIPPRHRPQRVKLYRNKKEVDLILKNYNQKLFFFVVAQD